MPVKVDISLSFKEPILVKNLSPDKFHGLFFSILPEDKAVSIHNIKGIKPFTICYKKFFYDKDSENKVRKAKLTITLLRDELFPYLSEGIVIKKNLKIDNTEVASKRIIGLKNINYIELFETSQYKQDITFKFETPTTFKKKESDYPLPDPLLTFRSILRKWNIFSPEDLKIFIDFKYLHNAVQIGGVWIKTKKVHFSKNIKITGFYGNVFHNIRSYENELLKKLSILSNFAEFSGVGRKTAMGFGKISLVEKEIEKTDE